MILRVKPPSSSVCLLLLCFFFIVLLSYSKTNAQNATNATLDPSEVKALNSIFQQWGVQGLVANSSWNISGKPCSGIALNQSDSLFRDEYSNLLIITCNCSFNSGTVCHITRLKAIALNIQEVLPEELLKLPYLKYLKIDKNSFYGPLPAFIGNMSKLELLSVGKNNFSGTLPPELGNLVNLQNLSIGGYNFSGTNSSEDYVGNHFSGSLPSELGNLVNLQNLDLGRNNFSGTLPRSLGKLVKLQQLDLSRNNFSGILPPELGNLVNLQQLRIDHNFFSGPLPAFIGNMSALGLLSIGHNNLSGPIPKELGNLKQLYRLDSGTINFTGTLPPELGNLVNLKEIFIDSCRLGGEIPETFAKLENLEIWWATDNAFTGKIPNFIGNNWTKLEQLRLEGNSFEGPIPSSFANLTSLKSLQISSIYNSSSSLDFVRNLKNLTYLVLRDVLLIGDFPTYITELSSLQLLDLSFNNLTGEIPSALFEMSSLEELYLGNNSLLGTIPSQKNEALKTIDLSYNFLSGDLPSWLDSTIDLNLVANNFTTNSANIRLFPGLECLQRSFPCNRNSPKYTSFAIKCGGPQMNLGGIEFEADDTILGPAEFRLSNAQNWAVSTIGRFQAAQNQLKYVDNTSLLMRSTSTPGLYQTSRMTPGSLRYYGLGLQNGPYTVHLHFAEIAFPPRSTHTWRSLGRRVFDVFIQGTRELRDFDISNEAGGVQIAITRNFTVDVTENYLEIHLFWAGKGTCCTPVNDYYGPLISAINVVPSFKPTSDDSKDWKRIAMVVGIIVPITIVALILIFVVFYLRRRKEDHEDEDVLLAIGPRGNTFSYSELKAATEDFSPSNKLGEGGYGTVFKGTLSDGRVVAVKQLSVASHQGKDQFLTEIATISAVQHRNLVKLYGCCIEGKRRLLVYEYLENKALDQALFGKNNNLYLDWQTRFNICLSTAKGLTYLHEGSRPKIVHRDVKASNILLDADLCPKISDFGLAKLYDDKKTHISTRIAGTIGYLAPEYAFSGHLTEKADVFSFGVVALEILSGRPNSDNTLESDKIYLIERAWNLYENNQSLGIVDPTLVEFDENEALRVLGVALLCTQASPMLRPPMSRVVAMLAGDIEVGYVTSKPSYLTYWDFKNVTGTFMSEDTQTSTASDNSNIKNSKGKTTPGTESINTPVNFSYVSEISDIIGEGR